MLPYLAAAAGAALLGVAYFYWTTTNLYKNGLPVKGLKPTFPWGNLSVLSKGVLEGLEILCKENADKETGIASFWVFSEQLVSCLRHEDVKEVLLNSSYRRPIARVSDHITRFLGTSALVVLNHDEWKHHRRVMSRAFHYDHLKAMVGDMCFASGRFVKTLASLPEGEAMDVYKVMKFITMDVIGLTAFGLDFCCGKDVSGAMPEVPAAFEELLEQLTERTYGLNPINKYYSLPTEKNRRHHACAKILRDKIEGVIEQRLKLREKRKQIKAGLVEGSVEEEHDDFLKHMIPENPEDAAFTPKELSDELLVMLFGGFDTTSIFLSYCLHLLAEHPEVERKVHEEVDRLFEEKEDGRLTFEDVSRMKYCNMVMKETLRLYPPAPLTTRTTTKEITVGGVRLPADTQIWLPISLIHREKHNYGDDAEEFKPERWDTDGELDPKSEKKPAIPQFAWIPFSGGPRNCIGYRFAMIEGVLVLAYLTRNFLFRPKDRTKGPIKSVYAGVIQKPLGGLWMTVHKREN